MVTKVTRNKRPRLINLLDNLEEAQDVVFAPNLVKSPIFGEVYKSFLNWRGSKEISEWTCKKTARPGDLYLFYFGDPEYKIAGLAVCEQAPDPNGWKRNGWSNRQKFFSCRFGSVYHFNKPITVQDLEDNNRLSKWFKSRPYHGRPKTIPQDAANTLLAMIAKREPKTRKILDLYSTKLESIPHRTIKDIEIYAREGTLNERLTRQRQRSKLLRDELFRKEMKKHGGKLICQVPGCGFDFQQIYGELGRGYAHAHHLKPLAKRLKQKVTKLTDLVVVCANCHAMIHRGRQCRPLKGLLLRPNK